MDSVLEKLLARYDEAMGMFLEHERDFDKFTESYAEIIKVSNISDMRMKMHELADLMRVQIAKMEEIRFAIDLVKEAKE